MRIRDNLSGLVASIDKPNQQNNTSKVLVGKVYGVITTINTPTKELFEKHGGYNGTGTIFYLDYNHAKNKNDDKVDLNICIPAIPKDSSVIDYPLIGELVKISHLPSANSQVTNNRESQKYYSKPINVWNSSQQNSPSGNTLGDSFTEDGDIRNLISFQGDRIYQGRKGNGIRFGSTTKKYSDLNEWSSIGKDGDPITIMVNGYITSDIKSTLPNVEEINKELSSIYMTSTQLLPLLPDRNDIVNPFTKPTLPSKYFNPQLILNSDRVTINSKKDEVMIYAKTNIELNTNNIINLNAKGRVHLNSGEVLLGTNPDSIADFEPVLLGLSTVDLLSNLMSNIQTFLSELQAAVSTPEGNPSSGINAAAGSLGPKLTSLMGKLEDLLSKQTYTS